MELIVKHMSFARRFCEVIVILFRRYSSTLELMRSRAQEQLSSKKSLIDKLYQDIAAHKHDLQLLQKQTEDVQRQQESLEDYLKALSPTVCSSALSQCTSHTCTHSLAHCTGTLKMFVMLCIARDIARTAGVQKNEPTRSA
jgi:hypothetical protein